MRRGIMGSTVVDPLREGTDTTVLPFQVLHTAMADIRESLNELKFYRRTIFKQPGIQYKDYLATLHGSKSHNRWGKK